MRGAETVASARSRSQRELTRSRCAPRFPPAKAVAPNKEIERLGVELADGLYPIVQGLQSKSVAPLASKVPDDAATARRFDYSVHYL